MLARAVVLPVGQAHRVLGVVADLEDGLVDLRAAPLAEPEEAILLAGAPPALGDEREGPGRKRGECGRPGGQYMYSPSLSTRTFSSPSGVR